MSRKYPQVAAGEWVQPKRKGYKMACCDCGLIHKLDFILVKNKRGCFIKFRAYRDERATGAYRRVHRIIVRDKKIKGRR